MIRPNPNKARKDLKRFCKTWGTPVTLKWLEFPPDSTIDPTTGGHSAKASASRQCVTKAMVHFVSPATGVNRMFSEVQTGDCILELVASLFRIEEAGDTGLAVGEVVDEYALLRANRDLAEGGASAVATEIAPNALAGVEVDIAGDRWVQQKVGEDLIRTWDAVFAGVRFAQSFLLRRAT